MSPDDLRIAVLVEDMSAASDISLRLYVEDLNGAGHHADIYSATTPKNQGDTLWPMGWHQGHIVLAVMTACSSQSAGVAPSAWHVIDAATGARLTAINNLCASGQSGILSRWPSPAGVACVDFVYRTSWFDWSGQISGQYHAGLDTNDAQSGLSPSGHGAFVSTETQIECGNGVPSTCIFLGVSTPGYPAQEAYVAGVAACLWIDEDHLLAPDAVITPRPDILRGGTVVQSIDARVTRLALKGVCAGRFPGGL